MSVLIAFLSLAAEALIGYPDGLFRVIGHPVTWLGRLIAFLDRTLNRATDSDSRRRMAGVAALLVPVGNLMVEATGSWQTVFYSVAIVNALAAFLALFVLKPLRARYVAAASSTAQRLTTRLAD